MARGLSNLGATALSATLHGASATNAGRPEAVDVLRDLLRVRDVRRQVAQAQREVLVQRVPRPVLPGEADYLRDVAYEMAS